MTIVALLLGTLAVFLSGNPLGMLICYLILAAIACAIRRL